MWHCRPRKARAMSRDKRRRSRPAVEKAGQRHKGKRQQKPPERKNPTASNYTAEPLASKLHLLHPITPQTPYMGAPGQSKDAREDNYKQGCRKDVSYFMQCAWSRLMWLSAAVDALIPL